MQSRSSAARQGRREVHSRLSAPAPSPSSSAAPANHCETSLGTRLCPIDEWTRACRVSDILPYTGVCCRLDGEQVALFRVGQGEAVCAIGNFDPFSRANVMSRGIVGDRAGRAKVASPIYKQSFCLLTGVCLDDPAVSVPVYEARVVEGIVEIRRPATRPPRAGNMSLVTEGESG